MKPGRYTTREAIKAATDPVSGSTVWQLTAAPCLQENIYGEVPYMDPTSRYLMFMRGYKPYGPQEVWRCDLQTHRLTLVVDRVPGIRGMAVSTDKRYFYCQRSVEGDYDMYARGPLEIVRTDIETLDQESIHFQGVPFSGSLGSMAPDGSTYIRSMWLGVRRFAIGRFDLSAATWDVIHEADDIHNAHPQVEPGEGRDVLIQNNRGSRWSEDGTNLASTGPEGATLFVIDIDGDSKRTLPIGKPHTWRCQGHQCWIGTTGEILFTVSAGAEDVDGDPAATMKREGNLLAITPGDERARVVARGWCFAHPSATLDGRFFVGDTSPEGTLVVGSLKTGKCRVLCESRTSFGSPQYTHPHPYFSPDRRWVIFNSTATGVPQIYAASVPEGLLEGLE